MIYGCLGIALNAGANPGVLLSGGATPQLATRCFVWQPQNCTDKNRQADRDLIQRISKKSPRQKAAAEILKDAWKKLTEKKDAVTALYRFNQVLLLSEDRKTKGEATWGAGAAYAALGLPSDAEKLLVEATKQLPTQTDTFLALARVHADQQNDVAKAEKVLQAGLEQNPADSELTAYLEELRARVAKK